MERSRIDEQIAPLWERNAIFPDIGIWFAKLAFSLARLLTIPRQFGPTILKPDRSASFLIVVSNCWPCFPISFPPAEIMTTPPTPASAHSLTIWRAEVMGVAMTARSTGAFRSLMEGQAGSFHSFLCLGLMGWTSPGKPRSIKLCIKAAPTLPFLSLAPTTAIDSGRKILSILSILMV